jgi:hypothetical protein
LAVQSHPELASILSLLRSSSVVVSVSELIARLAKVLIQIQDTMSFEELNQILELVAQVESLFWCLCTRAHSQLGCHFLIGAQEPPSSLKLT